MKEAQEHIQDALRILSAFSVSGDALDAIAAVKAHLREAYQLIKPKKETDGNG